MIILVSALIAAQEVTRDSETGTLEPGTYTMDILLLEDDTPSGLRIETVFPEYLRTGRLTLRADGSGWMLFPENAPLNRFSWVIESMETFPGPAGGEIMNVGTRQHPVYLRPPVMRLNFDRLDRPPPGFMVFNQFPGVEGVLYAILYRPIDENDFTLSAYLLKRVD